MGLATLCIGNSVQANVQTQLPSSTMTQQKQVDGKQVAEHNDREKVSATIEFAFAGLVLKILLAVGSVDRCPW